MQGQQFRFGADINTRRFVKITADDTVETAGAGEVAIGISHEGTWDTPIPGADGDLCAPAGESARVYQADEVCELVVGATPLAAGDLVKPDAAGAGVPAVATDKYSAICISGGAATQIAKVVVTRGSV